MEVRKGSIIVTHTALNHLHCHVQFTVKVESSAHRLQTWLCWGRKTGSQVSEKKEKHAAILSEVLLNQSHNKRQQPPLVISCFAISRNHKLKLFGIGRKTLGLFIVGLCFCFPYHSCSFVMVFCVSGRAWQSWHGWAAPSQASVVGLQLSSGASCKLHTSED